MPSLLVINRVYRLEIHSIMLVFSTPQTDKHLPSSPFTSQFFKKSRHLGLESISYFVHGPVPQRRRNRVSQRTNRAGIFKPLWSPGIDAKASIPPAYVCSLAGRYDNPIPTRCQAPIDFLKIPAQYLDSLPAVQT